MIRFMTTFAARLARLRRAAGLSQSELARRVGLTPASISLLESADSKGPSATTLIAIAAVLECNPAWLLLGRGSPEPASLTDDERVLLVAYRHLAPDARTFLLTTATALAAQAKPADPPADPASEKRH